MGYMNIIKKSLLLVVLAFIVSTPRTIFCQQETRLMLYCGAGIRKAAESLIQEFEKNNNIKIEPNYAGSGQLLGQISSIQKGDLFMPGDEFYVDRAIEKGLADKNTKRIVAYFIPVIFVKKGNPKNIKTLSDLKQNGLRIGIGDERCCAVGQTTMAIFRKNSINESETLKNIVYTSGTVDELGVAIQLGNVDAVIVWDATAKNFEKSGTIINIPAEQNIVSPIPIVLLKSSRYPGEAKKFIAFITSKKAKEILKEKGYTTALK